MATDRQKSYIFYLITKFEGNLCYELEGCTYTKTQASKLISLIRDINYIKTYTISKDCEREMNELDNLVQQIKKNK